MVRATRTLNPLPFQDLEPHRFEDLVRALLYDFRPWLKLEATGRGGSDDGFDARGWEANAAPPAAATPDEDDEPVADLVAGAQLWLIQCKRERAIGPKKLLAYLNGIAADQRKDLHGIIFAAACDFSKSAYDAFHGWAREAGISEYHLWGKAQLEDFLLQPKNDSLLFAFFGISLTLRRRSLQTELRSLIATKRKVIKLTGRAGDVNTKCVFRDPKDKRYPEPPAGLPLKPRGEDYNYHWFARAIVAVRHNGILVEFRNRPAYLSDDGQSYDDIPLADKAIPYYADSPWDHPADHRLEWQKTRNANAFWLALPEKNRARVRLWGFIAFERILAIDESGDDTTGLPTIFVTFDRELGPFDWINGRFHLADGTNADPRQHVAFFPDEFPEAPGEEAIQIPD